MTEPESVKAVAIGRGPYTSTYDFCSFRKRQDPRMLRFGYAGGDTAYAVDQINRPILTSSALQLI